MSRRPGLACSGMASLLLLIALMTACEIPGKGGLPVCSPDELERPGVLYPSMSDVVSLTPTITWSYPGTTCIPEGYKLEVWWSQNYLPGASAGYFVMGGYPRGTHFTWPTDAPLLPGQTYYLILKAVVAEGEGYYEGPGSWNPFHTGPLCSASEVPTAPDLRWFPDDWTVDPSGGLTLEWRNTLSCWPENGFHVQISKTGSFVHTVIDWDVSEEALWLNYVTTIIPIDNCTRYYWRAKTNFPGLDDEPYSEPWSFVTHIPGTLCPAEPLVPGIPPESIIPLVRLLENANCRSGPTTEYPVLDILTDGTELPIQGRNRAGDSWLVEDLTIGRNCWVSGSMVEVIGDTSLVGVIDPIPPETPTSPPPPPVNCAQYNSNLCSAQPACKLTANGCVNK